MRLALFTTSVATWSLRGVACLGLAFLISAWAPEDPGEDEVSCDLTMPMGAGCTASIKLTELFHIPPEGNCSPTYREIKITVTLTCGENTCTRVQKKCDTGDPTIESIQVRCAGETYNISPGSGQTWPGIMDGGNTCTSIAVTEGGNS
jgi:hypothetical protein